MPNRMYTITTRSAACLLLGAGLAAPAAAVDGASTYTGRVIGGAWFAALGGDFSYDGEFTDGSTFTTDEFGLDDLDSAPMIEVGLNLPILFDLHAGYASYGASGSKTFTSPRTFNDMVVSGDTSIEVEVVDLYGEVMWRVLNLDLGGVGVGLAVHYIDAEAHVDSTAGSESGAKSFPLPALSGRAFVNPWGGFSAEVKLHLMTVDLADVQARYVDFHALLGFRPIEWVGIEAGYRFIQYDFDVDFDGEEHLKLDLSLSGPFLGAIVQF